MEEQQERSMGRILQEEEKTQKTGDAEGWAWVGVVALGDGGANPTFCYQHLPSKAKGGQKSRRRGEVVGREKLQGGGRRELHFPVELDERPRVPMGFFNLFKRGQRGSP